MALLKDLFVRGTGLMNQCWMKYLGLHNKPKAAVHLELLPTGPWWKKKKGFFPGGKVARVWNWELTHRTLRLIMGGAISPLSHMCSWHCSYLSTGTTSPLTFMIWTYEFLKHLNSCVSFVHMD
jgi:hypothetical protein